MTPNELRQFLAKHNLSQGTYALIIGVTKMAVVHWLDGRRSMSLTVSRLTRFFDKRPELMREFIGEMPPAYRGPALVVKDGTGL